MRHPNDLTIALANAAHVKATANAGIEDKRSHKFKESAMTTWRGILKIAQRRMRHGKATPAEDGTYKFLFTNDELATLAGCSTRTVQRHRETLQDVGLIARQEWRGRQHPFAVYIHGRYLGLLQPLSAVDIEMELAFLTDEIEQIDYPSPPSPELSSDKLSALPEEEENKNLIEPVEKVPAGRLAGFAPPQHGDDDDHRDGHGTADGKGREHGNTDGQAADQHSGQNAAQGAAIGRTGGGGAAAQDPRRKAAIEAKTDLLWEFAHRSLWPGAPLTDANVAGARHHIRNLYAKCYDHQQDLEHWHGIFTGMVETARRYVERNAEKSWGAQMAAAGGGGSAPKLRFVPRPDLWFNPTFAGGFKGTYEWYQKAEYHRKEAAKEVAVLKAWRLWKKNEKAPPSKKREALGYWRELTDQLSTFNCQHTLDRWMALFVPPAGDDQEGGQNA